jgi:hypothetical protein
MKISAEVREFARLNPMPEGENLDRGTVEAEAGMEQMSKRFHEEGGEIYIPAAE